MRALLQGVNMVAIEKPYFIQKICKDGKYFLELTYHSKVPNIFTNKRSKVQLYPFELFKHEYCDDSFNAECFEDLELYIKVGINFLRDGWYKQVKSLKMFKFLLDHHPTQTQELYNNIPFFQSSELHMQCVKYVQETIKPVDRTNFFWGLTIWWNDNFEILKHLLTSMSWNPLSLNKLFMILYTQVNTPNPKQMAWLNMYWSLSDYANHITPLTDEQMKSLNNHRVFCNSAWLRINLYHHPKLANYPNLLYVVNADRALVHTLKNKLQQSTSLPEPLVRFYVLPALI